LIIRKGKTNVKKNESTLFIIVPGNKVIEIGWIISTLKYFNQINNVQNPTPKILEIVISILNFELLLIMEWVLK